MIRLTHEIPALGRIGPAAKDAIPSLERELHSSVPNSRLDAADAILQIAPTNAAAAVSVLHDLEHMPPTPVYYANSQPRAAPLAFRTYPGSNYFRLAAQVSMWRAGLDDLPSVSEIVAEMENPKRASGIARWVDLLGDIGPEAKSALPALEKHLEPFAYPHAETAIAIRKIDPKEADRLNLPGVLALP